MSDSAVLDPGLAMNPKSASNLLRSDDPNGANDAVQWIFAAKWEELKDAELFNFIRLLRRRVSRHSDSPELLGRMGKLQASLIAFVMQQNPHSIESIAKRLA